MKSANEVSSSLRRFRYSSQYSPIVGHRSPPTSPPAIQFLLVQTRPWDPTDKNLPPRLLALIMNTGTPLTSTRVAPIQPHGDTNTATHNNRATNPSSRFLIKSFIL
ncbi:Hypothetical protein NTJ_10684 [Nesidiocoris tenuis]|uniref:Uncharacterized protein n=1 Tax=Nesidiocoris tenuis TaxID=355587 RepID=A0ABN7B0D8_9HEMI|nr:Hypothetical protein NTJ_10684 [Nesidiocoris tenuis]